MVLSEEQILRFCQSPLNDKLVKRARHLFKSHSLHVKGVGLDEFLYRIEGYENQAQHVLRQKLAKPSTVPLFAKELDVFSKIFTAQGFSRYYQFSPATAEQNEKDLKQYLSDVGEGMSIQQWMRDIWLDKVNHEPCGILMVELPNQTTSNQAEPYLTFKTVMDLWDIELNGNKIEYLIFVKELYDSKTKESTKQFRVVDDQGDYIVNIVGGEYKIDFSQTLENPWGYVPAIMVSNQRDFISKGRTSYIWKSIEVADEYLLDSSIHTISKKLHGFPMRWMRQRACRKCQAKGQINTGKFADDNVTPLMISCVDCGGTGVAIKTDVSEVILIPQLEGKEDVDNLPVAGYVVPDIESLKQQNEEADRLAKAIHLGIWANPEAEKTETTAPESATGRILDVQVINNKLLLVSDNAAEVERFLTNCIAQVRYGEDYLGSIINYGKKYYIQAADEVESIYQSAKRAGMPTHLLDSYVEEIIYLKYGNDPLELERQLMLNRIEPFIHLSTKEVQSLGVPIEDYLLKVYFTDFIERYEDEVKPIVLSTKQEIVSKLNEYLAEKVALYKAEEAEEAAELAKSKSQ